MGIIAAVERRGTLENPSTPLSSDAAWLYEALGARSTASGVRVTPDGSMQVSAVAACVRIIAEAIGSLPFPVYRRLPHGGKERSLSHPLYRVLHDRPNPEMASVTFREVLQTHLLLWGNAYAEIERDGAGRPLYLWPIHPGRVTVRRRGGRKEYLVRVEGESDVVRLSDDEMLHIPGLGFDGLVGFSPIEMARQAIGVALAAEEYGARFYANDARPSLALKVKGRIKDESARRLKEDFLAAHGGSGRLGVAVLEEDMDLAAVGIPPEHAQFLETRKFQVAEIARIFRVPPHLIGDVERSTSWGTGIEQQNIGFIVHTLRPWAVRWEQVVNWDLFGDRSPFFAEFLLDGLLRGDMKSRSDALAVMRQNGIINADEWREIENMNPQPGGAGKVYLANGSMKPVDMLDDPPAAAAPPPDPPADDDDDDDEGDRADDILPDIQRRHTRLFVDAAQAAVRRECAGVRAALRKAFGGRDAVRLRAELDEFYEGQAAWTAERFGSLLLTYAENVAAGIGRVPDVGEWAAGRALALGREWAERSRARLHQLATLEPDEIEPAIEQCLDEWLRTRAAAEAENEARGAAAAVASLDINAAA